MPRNRVRFAIYFAVLLSSITVARLAGQTLFGRISGSVTDPTGAAVPGVKVTIVNAGTQAARMVTTDNRGFYVAENLPIGSYQVAVEHPGFRKETRGGYQLAADGHITADFTLQVGEASQTVEVMAQAQQINTTSGEVAHVIDKQQVDNVPLNGRAYVELLTLVPGAIVTNPDQFSVLTSLSATNQSLNGHRTNENNLTVDGVGNLDNGSNGSLINNVSPDFLEEVKIQASNFSAEYGRSTGATFNVVTKGGSNQFHGGAYEYLRNDLLDARNFFSPNRTELRFNDWGYYLGGPIKKNKIFFFVGEEWRKIRQQSAPVRETLPSTSELQGIFPSSHIIDYPGTKTPFPNNTIPASMITPDGQAIANVFKTVIPQTATFADTGNSNDATFESPNPLDYREDIGRIDYQINLNHMAFLRWIDDYNSIYLPFGPSSASGSYLPITPEIRDRPGKSFLLSETWVISPTVVNEAHLGASWNSQHYGNQGDTWERTTQGFTFQRVFNSAGPYVNGIPDVNINNFTQWQGPEHTLISPTTEIEAGDTISIVRGQHSIRTGVLIIRNRKDQNGRSDYDGNIVFNPSGFAGTTGYALADALLGNFQTYTEAAYDPMGFYRYTEPAAFIDDTWKVARKLSLNLGLRYEYMMAMYSAADNLAEFVPSLYNPAQAVELTSSGNALVPGVGNIYNGLVRVANGVNPARAYVVPNATDPSVLAVPAGAPRGMYPNQSTWQPRLGFAYSINPKTVIRGGFGLFYDRIQGNPTFYTLNNPPYVGSAQYTYGNLSNITGGSNVVAPWGTIQTIDPHLKIPYSEQFSLTVQRELPLRLFAEASYVGTLGRHLLDEPDINQPSFAIISTVPSTTVENTIRPYAGYSTIQQFESRATSNYNSLQLQIMRRAGRVLFTTAYTFSKNLGTASSDTSNNHDYFNPRLYYGPLDYDVRHVLVGTAVLQLPTLKAQNRFLRGPFGNWQLSAIVHVQSGFYQTITGSPPIVGSRPADYVGGPAVLPNPGPNGWYNKTAFVVAPYNRWGTSGEGNVEGPGMQIYNLSVAKFFALTERFSLRFRADFENAFNCVNFQNPSTDISSSNFGTISAAYPPRNIQLNLMLRF